MSDRRFSPSEEGLTFASGSYATATSSRVSRNTSGMYSDLKKRSVKDRLQGASDGPRSVGRQSVNKRQRVDDGKWKHDLYDDEDVDDSGTINGHSGTRDLRTLLSRKKPLRSGGQASSAAGPPVKDLREKLSGSAPPPPPPQLEERKRLHSIVRGSAASASVAPPRPPVARSNPPPPKPQAVQEQTVTSFLTSLGLEKYLLTFQAEEVDMAALRHMRDEDLKELNVPMGPRKKILLALAR